MTPQEHFAEFWKSIPSSEKPAGDGTPEENSGLGIVHVSMVRAAFYAGMAASSISEEIVTAVKEVAAGCQALVSVINRK